jgi:glycosyltransferase involved in cell wall biosynthesis
MKLLVLSPVFPDAPSDGDRLRLFHWLQHLGRKHQLTLACLADPRRAKDWGDSRLGAALGSVERVAWARWQKALSGGKGLAGALPVNVSTCASASFRRLVDRLMERERYDAVFAYRLKMAPYALRFKGPRFLDYTDSLTRYTERRAMQAALEGRGAARRYLRWQSQKLAAYEAWVAGQFDGLFVNAATDALALRAMAPRFASRIHVAANGVDPHLLSSERGQGPLRRGAKLVFVGHLAYAPNIEAVLWFAQEVLPRILAQRPDATFEVVGGDAPQSILSLAGKPGVRLHGYQPDTLPYLAAAAISVCPVRTGAGRQNKLMEAFAYGLPAVATKLAAQGAEAEDGKQLLAADSAEGFAQAVLTLLQKPDLGRRLAKEAAGLVKSKYDWARNSRDLESVLVSRSR